MDKIVFADDNPIKKLVNILVNERTILPIDNYSQVYDNGYKIISTKKILYNTKLKMD